MKIAGLKIVGVCLVVGTLAGCGGQGSPTGFGGISEAGPDEFGIVPIKPLQLPKNFDTLPEPDPKARNLTDPLPEHDAVAALGGQPSRLDSTKINAGEGAIVAAASRNGVAKDIREVLAEEDKTYRENNGPKFLQRIFKINTYLNDYEKQSIKARKTNDRLRRRGIKTPSVGPEER